MVPWYYPIMQSTVCAQFTSAYVEIAGSTSLQAYSCKAYLIKVLNSWGGLMLKVSFYHTIYLVVLSLEVDCAFMGCLLLLLV